MHRAQPVANHLCADKLNARSYTLHRQKLATVKADIDNRPPKMYPHLYQKLKKAQVEEERCSEIERDNRTLVHRMGDIMRRSGLDNGKPPTMLRSLNKVRRRQELARITKENLSLLKRIREKQPTYNHLAWEHDREKSEQLCDRICRYPYRPHGNGSAPPGSALDHSGFLQPRGGSSPAGAARITAPPISSVHDGNAAAAAHSPHPPAAAPAAHAAATTTSSHAALPPIAGHNSRPTTQ